MNPARLWELEHPEETRKMQQKSSQKYYYKNREKVLAKKQQKYAESRGAVIVKIDEVKEPEIPAPVIEPIVEPKWIHPFFNK